MSGWQEPNSRRGQAKRTGLVITSTIRLANSVWGNPRWRVHFTDGTSHITSSDASVNYEVDNFTARDKAGKPVDIVVTRAGRIIYMRLSERNSQ